MIALRPTISVARKRLARKKGSFEWKAAAFDDAGAAAR